MANKFKTLLDGKKVLITGGTGSLGKEFLKHALSGNYGVPEYITVFSRDEAKQFYLRSDLKALQHSSDAIMYSSLDSYVRFVIGDVRDYNSVRASLKDHDIVIHAAALKQVPSCEMFPDEAMKTNCIGSMNLIQAIEDGSNVEKCVFVSTDKAAKPTNAMGISKALQEKLFIAANFNSRKTSYTGVRYGNVIASRGSVIPVFIDQITNKQPITITDDRMTRFLLTLDQAVETIFVSILEAEPGEIIVPNAISARVVDIAQVLAGSEDYPIEFTGIRPGEKLHEIMIGIEDAFEVRALGKIGNLGQDFFAICPRLPTLVSDLKKTTLPQELSSADNLISPDMLRQTLIDNSIILGNGELTTEFGTKR